MALAVELLKSALETVFCRLLWEHCITTNIGLLNMSFS